METKKSKRVGENLERENQRRQLLEQAREGDENACNEFYAQFEAEGIAEDFVLFMTDIAHQTLRVQEPDLILREAFRRKMLYLHDQLGGRTATPLEGLLIERIGCCWKHLYDAELRMASASGKALSIEAATFREKALDRAQKRYLSAVMSLALVRKLKLPTVQINIADKQINMAQSGNALPGTMPYLEDSSFR